MGTCRPEPLEDLGFRGYTLVPFSFPLSQYNPYEPLYGGSSGEGDKYT